MVKALVLYHSQEFRNTAAMAEAVAEGLRQAGAEVDLFNTNDGRFDVTTFSGSNTRFTRQCCLAFCATP